MKILPGMGPSSLLQAFLDVTRWRASGQDRLGRRQPIALFPLETGGCEGCAMEVSALAGSAFALEQHGFCLVSEPEDADWLLVTGPVTRASADALDRNWRAMPRGRSLVAVGDCAISGGPFATNYAALGGLDKLASVRMQVPGCPPSPQDLLLGLEALATGQVRT